jgi:hypothetical protein
VSGAYYMRAARLLEAEVGDELVALDPRGEHSFELNALAATVWRSLAQPKSFDQLRDELLVEYDVSSDRCSRDLRELLGDLIRAGFIEERGNLPRTSDAAPSIRPPSGAARLSAGPAQLAATAEFLLLVECCRGSFADVDQAEAVLRTRVDWPRFLRLVRFHRVAGLAWHSLSAIRNQLPGDVASELSADATAIAQGNLHAAVECRDLLQAFEHAGIPLLFVKGLTLGALAYGSIAIKHGVDIDLLVPEPKLAEAADLLRGIGYRLAQPPTLRRLQRWHHHRKESTWIHDGRLPIDLHTRLADHPGLILSVGLGSPRQLVEIADGIVLPTFGREELFAYLSVHGASSAWFRLKWIADFAALLHSSSPAEIEVLYRRSQELGAGRAAAQALLLADAIFGSLDGLDPLRDRLTQDPASRWLFHSALTQLAGRIDPVEPTARPFGTLRIHLSQLPLLPGWRFPLSELVRQARAALA